jgi:hypothetical protein
VFFQCASWRPSRSVVGVVGGAPAVEADPLHVEDRLHLAGRAEAPGVVEHREAQALGVVLHRDLIGEGLGRGCVVEAQEHGDLVVIVAEGLDEAGRDVVEVHAGDAEPAAHPRDGDVLLALHQRDASHGDETAVHGRGRPRLGEVQPLGELLAAGGLDGDGVEDGAAGVLPPHVDGVRFWHLAPGERVPVVAQRAAGEDDGDDDRGQARQAHEPGMLYDPFTHVGSLSGWRVRRPGFRARY